MRNGRRPLARRALAGVCAAVLPPEAGGPDPDHLAAVVERFLQHASLPTRTAVPGGAALIGALAWALTGHPLTRLSPERRAAVLERLARHGGTAAALDGLKSLLMLAHGADAAAADLRERSGRQRPVRPDAELSVTPSTDWPSRTRAGAVVVGSGAGGAMVARTLARAGIDVVVLEEGRRFRVEEFRTRHPLDRYSELYRDGGATVALGRPPVILPVGRGVGGTTLVNSGTCFRPPLAVQRRWRDEWGLSLADPDSFAAYLDDVEATLRVGPVPLDVMGRNGRLLLEAADALGWRARPITRNAPGCDGCCQCAIGCPQNAKTGVHLNALPEACAHGARIVSEARVRHILVEHGHAVGVEAARPDGSGFEVFAPIVVAAAGATETPGLLRRSGLGSHAEIGRNLTVHPALAVTGRFPDPVVAWHGVLQSATIEEFHERDGILIEATAGPPGMGSSVLPGFGPALLREMEAAAHLATFGAMIGDRPSGVVRSVAGRTVITYTLARREGERLLRAIGLLGRALFGAGALEVFTGIAGAAPVRSVAELEESVAAGDHRRLHVAAFHPAGTVRAGADPGRCPVDGRGRLRGTEGLWVADASVLPTCPEVNPQVSIMAVAQAIADGIIGES